VFFYRVLSFSLSFFFVKRIADENNFSLFLSLSLSFREQTRGVTAGYRQVLAEEQIIVGGASLLANLLLVGETPRFFSSPSLSPFFLFPSLCVVF